MIPFEIQQLQKLIYKREQLYLSGNINLKQLHMLVKPLQIELNPLIKKWVEEKE